MNKKIAVFALLASFASFSSAFASEDDFDLDGLVPADQLSETLSDSGAEVGDVQDSLAPDFYGENENPGYSNDRRDRDHHNRGYVCYAENRYGRRFQGFGRNAQWAQQEAMNECQRSSHHSSCRPRGCRRT
jgi:hypothetical protein